MEKPTDQRVKESKATSPGPMETINMYSHSATIHGISNVAAPQLYKFHRIIWICLLLTMSVGLGVLLSRQFRRYFDYPFVTVVKADFREEVSFPAVTICNSNQYHRDRIPDDRKILNLLYNFSEFADLGQYLYREPNKTALKRGGVVDYSGNYIHTMVMNAAHTLDELFVYCQWRSRWTNCSDMFERVVTDSGVCYRFNSNTSSVLSSFTTGPFTGLRVILDIQQHFSFFSTMSLSGVKVLLNEPDEAPNFFGNGLYLRPGTSTSIAIRKEEVIALEKPHKAFGNTYCYNNRVGGFKTPLKRFANFSYTQTACLANCMLNYLAERCKCRHPLAPGEEDYCSVDQLQNCFIPNSKGGGRRKLYNICGECPSTCHTTKYVPQMSSADFASSFIIDYLIESRILTDKDYIRNNVIDLRIFYDTLTVSQTVQKPELTISDIMADLGGHMGLFLGASLLSLSELIEFMVLFVLGFMNKRGLWKSTSPTSNKHNMDAASDEVL